jgi:VanZ family protein
MWSWPSLVGAVMVLVAASTGLELVQERVAPGRITETSDIVANLGGIALGVALVLVVNAGSGLPARIRRLSRRRADRSR